MAGSQIFTSFSLGKETTAGTSVPTTQEWYPDGTGMFDVDNMMSIYRGNRGTFTNAVGGIETGEFVTIPYRSNPDIGAGYDELHKVFGQLDGGNTGVGAGADKTWTILPPQTSAASPESYTIEVGDDTQYWEIPYCQASDFTISAERGPGGMTQLEVNWFGQKAVKVTATTLAANTMVRIPAYLWGVKFASAQSGLTAASESANLLTAFSARYETGLSPRFYLDGSKWFGQTQESQPKRAEVSLTVESTATAVSQFYDKWRSNTVDFMRLGTLARGPSLGSSNYGVTLDFALLYTKVEPIAAESEGVNLYNITAETVYDSTWANSMSAIIVNSIATLT